MDRIITASVEDLHQFATKWNARGFETGESILRDGWDHSCYVTLEVKGGGAARLSDGNRRIDYLARHGMGETLVPVYVKLFHHSRGLDKIQVQH